LSQDVETYRVKKKENHVPVVSEVTIQQIKVQRPVRYSCHICDDTKHKIIDYPKYNYMQNMCKNKGMKPIDKQVVVEPKVFKSFGPYGGCEYGHHQEQGY